MKKLFTLRTFISLLITICIASCSPYHKIARQANLALINDSIASHAHIGISIFEPGSGKYWYNHNADKYFTPASNTKLFTLYAGLKYLGDSLPGLKVSFKPGKVFIVPTGDPTFLHPQYPQQRVFDFLHMLRDSIVIINSNWKEDAFGRGWAWDDYNSDDMIERSSFPIYNNSIRWIEQHDSSRAGNVGTYVFSEPDINWSVKFTDDSTSRSFKVIRDQDANVFRITFGKQRQNEVQIPFITHGLGSALELLRDTLHKSMIISVDEPAGNFTIVHSRPVDSLFIPMMHRSDNFFAEQTLLMVSNVKLGYMNDFQIINHLIKNDLHDIPQKPTWVDGSGLSRYNLFTPKDLVYIINKLKEDFGLARLKTILPTGGTGTLSSLYKKDSGYIFAKTGTLSNQTALSGFLITKKEKLVIFSILVNDFQAGATPIRKAIEKFLSYIRQHN